MDDILGLIKDASIPLQWQVLENVRLLLNYVTLQILRSGRPQTAWLLTLLSYYAATGNLGQPMADSAESGAAEV